MSGVVGGDAEQTAADLRAVCEDGDKPKTDRIRAAWALLNLGKLARSRADVFRALRLIETMCDAADESTIIRVADLYIEIGEYNFAVSAAERLAEESPTYRLVALYRAIALDKKDRQIAQGVILGLLEQDGGSFDYWMRLSHVVAGVLGSHKALQAARRAMQAVDADPRAGGLRLVEALLNLGERDAALTEFKRVLAAEPSIDHHGQALSNWAFRIGEIGLAIQIAEAWSAGKPDDRSRSLGYLGFLVQGHDAGRAQAELARFIDEVEVQGGLTETQFRQLFNLASAVNRGLGQRCAVIAARRFPTGRFATAAQPASFELKFGIGSDQVRRPSPDVQRRGVLSRLFARSRKAQVPAPKAPPSTAHRESVSAGRPTSTVAANASTVVHGGDETVTERRDVVLHTAAAVYGPADVDRFVELVEQSGFSASAYRDAHPDLITACRDAPSAFAHFLGQGVAERRRVPMKLDIPSVTLLSRAATTRPERLLELLAALTNASALAAIDSDVREMHLALAQLRQIRLLGGRPFILVGDSHSNIFRRSPVRDSGWLIPLHVLCGAGSAAGLANPESRSGYGKLISSVLSGVRDAGLLDPGLPVFFQFGQVDVEFVFTFRRLRDGAAHFDRGSFDTFCEEVVQRYVAFIAGLFPFHRRGQVSILSIFPPSLSDEKWSRGYVNGHVMQLEGDGDSAAMETAVAGLAIPNLSERTEMHRHLNTLLKDACLRRSLNYVDCFDCFIGSEGVLDNRYIPNSRGADHHLEYPATDREAVGVLWRAIERIDQTVSF